MRVEGFTGSTLFAANEMACREVRDDAHGNPIPIVTRLAYDVTKTGLDLSQLHVIQLSDSVAAAETNAKVHREVIGRTSTTPIRDENSLCATDGAALSCQLVSPYSGNIPLVVYCEAAECVVPVIAMNAHMAISTSWAVDDTFWSDPEQAGRLLMGKVQSIHSFLEPLSSGI